MVQLQSLLLVIEDCNLFKLRGQKFSGKHLKTAKEIQRIFALGAVIQNGDGAHHSFVRERIPLASSGDTELGVFFQMLAALPSNVHHR